MKKLKENQNKQFTTDANGNILLIKGPGVDRLQGEFFIPKMNILEKATIHSANLSNKEAKLDKKDTQTSRIPSSHSKIYQKLPVMNKGIGFLESSNINTNNITNFLMNANSTMNISILNNNNNSNVNAKNANETDKLVSILPAGSSFE